MSARFVPLLVLALFCSLGVSCVSADGPPFVARLPHGAVELVGLADFPAASKSQWWRPDGSAAAIGPYRPRRIDPYWRRFRGLKTVSFVFRGENLSVALAAQANAPAAASGAPLALPAGAPAESLNAPRKPSGSLQYGPLVEPSWPAWGINGRAEPGPPTVAWSEGMEVLDARGNQLPNHWMYTAAFALPLQTVDFAVGISAGAWETVASSRADSAATARFRREGQEWSVTFPKVKSYPIRITTTVAYPAAYGKLRRRLLVVGNDGSEHASSEGDYGKLAIDAVFSDLPLNDVKELRFQVRPYAWVGFKNVSLYHGQPTQVQVVSSDPSVNVQK